MKKLTITALLLACFSLAIYSQEETKTKQQPKATYQVGSAKVVVWENKNEDGTTWKNFEIEKVYKTKDGQWKTTNSFNETDLLKLKAAIDKAIAEEGIKEETTEEEK